MLDKKSLTIRLSKIEENFFYVEVYELDCLIFKNKFELRLHTLSTYEIIEKLENYPSLNVMKSFGLELYEKVFDGFKLSYDEILSIHISIEAGDLASLPWEFLYDGNQFLSLTFPFTRLMMNIDTTEKCGYDYPLKMLVIISNPLELEDIGKDLDVDYEIFMLEQSLSTFTENGFVSLYILENPTAFEIRETLASKKFNLLHFIGHGFYNFDQGASGLQLSNEKGGVENIGAVEIAELFSSDSLKFIFLNACQTAKTPTVKTFPSSAYELVKNGIPAVIAMQFTIPDQQASNLSALFYQKFFSQNNPFSIDSILQEVRRDFFENEASMTVWGTPVLVQDISRKHIVNKTPLPLTDIFNLQTLDAMKEKYRNIVGRSKSLWKVKKYLENNVKLIYIYGLAGIGKTTFIHSFMKKVTNQFDGKFLYTFNENSNIESVFDELNRFLINQGDFTFDKRNSIVDDILTKIELIVESLNHKKYLLVFDNVDSALDVDNYSFTDYNFTVFIEAMHTSFDKCQFIIVSRYKPNIKKLNSASNTQELQLLELTKTQAFRFMNRTNSLSRNETSLLDQERIYQKFGGHPLTLNLISSLLDDMHIIDILELPHLVLQQESSYLELFLKKLFDKASTYELSVLKQISVFRKFVDVNLINFFCWDEDTLLTLKRKSLIIWDGSSYSQHALIKTHLIDQMTKDEIKELNRMAADYYFNLSKEVKSEDDKMWALYDSWLHLMEAKEYNNAANTILLIVDRMILRGYIKLAEKALFSTLSELSNPNANLLLYLGIAKKLLGDRESSKEALLSAVEAFENVDSSQLSKALAELGSLYLDIGDYQNALQTLERCKKLKEEDKDFVGLAKVLHDLGTYHLYRREHEKALSSYFEALKLQKAHGDAIGERPMLFHIGIAYRKMNDLANAEQYLLESLNVSERYGYLDGIAAARHHLSFIYIQKGDLKSAIVECEESIKISYDIKLKRNISDCYEQRGLIHLIQGDLNEALRDFEKSYEGRKEVSSLVGQASSLRRIGLIYLKKNQYKKAVNYFMKSMKLYEKVGILNTALIERVVNEVIFSITGKNEV